MRRLLRFCSLAYLVVGIAACSSSSPAGSKVGAAPQRGFWDSLSDRMTERECSVYRFSCPYGFGPAGEPCDCTDPRGFVVKGTTVKSREP
jgi:hypothetical protein